METKITSTTDNEAKFTVTLNEAELKLSTKHVYDELRPRVKAAGFRPGKAPDAIVERELGPNTVQGEVIEHAIQEAYVKAVREQKLQVVASPQVSVDKFVPYTELEFSVIVELMPKVTLPEYKAFRLKRPSIAVDPAEVDAAIEDLRRREATRLEVERPAEKSDEVNFDFAGTKDGEPVRGATATGQTLKLDSGQFIPGFEDELVGMKSGEDKSFDIRFPKEYHEETLAGQVVTFKVKMNKVTELILPAVDDALAAKVGPFKTVAELKADLSEQQTAEKAETVSRQYEQDVLDKLLKESNFKAPESLVKQQLVRLRSELEQNLAYSGLNFDKYLELSGKTQDQMDAEMRPEAEKRVGLAMILTDVATAEGVNLSAEDLDAEIVRLKGQYNDEATQAELDNPRTREEVYNHLMASRVIAKLVGYAESK